MIPRRLPDETYAEWQERRRLGWVEQYSDFHDRQWLESLTYVELLCRVRSGELDRPTLL